MSEEIVIKALSVGILIQVISLISLPLWTICFRLAEIVRLMRQQQKVNEDKS